MGDKSADGLSKNRIALGDVSNQLGKRRFVSISSGTSGIGHTKKLENDGGKVLFPVKIDNLGKGKCVFEFGGKGGSSVLKPKEFGGVNVKSGISQKPGDLNANQLGGSRIVGNQENTNAIRQSGRVGISGNSSDTKEPSSLGKGCLQLSRGDALNTSGGPKEILMPRVSDDCDKSQSSVSVEDGTESEDETGSDMSRNLGGSNDEGTEGGELTSDKSNPFCGSIPSSGSQEIESEKCVFSNFDGSSNSTMGIDFLKTCSCSFCLKALKRSRKDVRSVIEKSCTYGGFGKNVQAVTTKPTKLEHDLMSQWRSLFLHTEDVLIRESSQLQTSLLNLKELRDSCKADLETTNATPSNI